MKKEQFIICQNRGQFFLEKWKFHQKRNRKKNHSYLFKEWKKSGHSFNCALYGCDMWIPPDREHKGSTCNSCECGFHVRIIHNDWYVLRPPNLRGGKKKLSCKIYIKKIKKRERTRQPTPSVQPLFGREPQDSI